MNVYSSIQFSADVNVDHFMIKKQCIHVFSFVFNDTFMFFSSDAV